MRKILPTIGLVGALTVLGAGCETVDSRRPYVSGGEDYDISTDFDLGSFDEKASKHKAKGTEILGEEYYLARTQLGMGLFRKNKSFLENTYSIEEGEVKGESSRQSGEKGIYVMESEKDSDGEELDWVSVSPRDNKADIKKPKETKRRGGLGIFEETEENSQFEIEYVKIGGRPHYAVRVEKKKLEREKIEREEKGIEREEKYSIYLIPVDNSKLRVGQNGRMIIINENQIKRPHFRSLEELSKGKPEDDTQSGTGDPQDSSTLKVREKPYECPEFEIKENKVTAPKNFGISCTLKEVSWKGNLEDYVKAFKEATPEGVFLEDGDGKVTWLKEGEVYNIPQQKGEEPEPPHEPETEAEIQEKPKAEVEEGNGEESPTQSNQKATGISV